MSSSTRYTSSRPQLSASSAQKIHRESAYNSSYSSSTAKGKTRAGELRLSVRIRRCLPCDMRLRVSWRGTWELWSLTERVSQLSPMPLYPAFCERSAMSSSFQASKMQCIYMLSTSQRSYLVWLRLLHRYFSRCPTYRSIFSLKLYSLPNSYSFYTCVALRGAFSSTALRNCWMARLQTYCPIMNSYFPISSYESSSYSYEKSIRMHRSNSPGSGQIFWFSLPFSTSTSGKFCSNRPRNCSRSPSVTAPGRACSFRSSSRSAKRGRRSSSPAASQRSVVASHSAKASTCGLHLGGEDSSILQISLQTCWVVISWFSIPSSACCCLSSSSLIITFRPRSAISPASTRSGCARRYLHSSSSLKSRSLLSASEERLMWTGSSGSSLGGRLRRGLMRSSFLLLLSSSMSRSLERGNLALSAPVERQRGRSQPSFLASVTAWWASRRAAWCPLAMSSLARSRQAFCSVYLCWMCWRRSRNACWEMFLFSRSMLSLRISSTSRLFTRSSLSWSISCTLSLGALPNKKRFNWPLLSRGHSWLGRLAVAISIGQMIASSSCFIGLSSCFSIPSCSNFGISS